MSNKVRRAKFSGRVITDKELSHIAAEYASSIFQALAMNVPVKLVTIDQVEAVQETDSMRLKENGATFFTVASPRLEKGISRITTVLEVRKLVLEQCRAVVGRLLQVWPTKYGNSPMYILAESQVSLSGKNDDIEVYVALHVAGNELENKDAIQKEASKESVPALLQPEVGTVPELPSVSGVYEMQEVIDGISG